MPQLAASPAAVPNVASVRVINASGVTRRQIAKPQIARPQFAKAQTVSRKVRNLPVASLKKSILS